MLEIMEKYTNAGATTGNRTLWAYGICMKYFLNQFKR